MTDRASRSSSAPASSPLSMLFPTLHAEDGPVLIHVQRLRRVSVAAVDLAQAVQAERNYAFVHIGVGVFYVLVTLGAAVLGVIGRDRGQFVFAALFAWLAIGEWQGISASLPASLASGVWPRALWDCVWNALMLLAAAQLLQVRERAPRWNRWMVVTAVLFLLVSPLSQIEALSTTARAVFIFIGGTFLGGRPGGVVAGVAAGIPRRCGGRLAVRAGRGGLPTHAR